MPGWFADPAIPNGNKHVLGLLARRAYLPQPWLAKEGEAQLSKSFDTEFSGKAHPEVAEASDSKGEPDEHA
jgi:hypothetical protein